jgi:transcription initiation factor IIE alpha subunit
MYSQRLIRYKKKEEKDPEYKTHNLNVKYTLRFKTEAIKDVLGNSINKFIKEHDDDFERPEDPLFCEQYLEVELKYKVAKMLESKS